MASPLAVCRITDAGQPARSIKTSARRRNRQISPVRPGGTSVPAGPGGITEGRGQRERLARGGHIVHTMPEQALFPEHGRSHLGGAAPFLGGEAQQLPEHGLHGQAHEHGPSEGEPVFRMGQQLQIMAQGLAETDAGIQHDVLFRQTGGGQTVQLALEKGHDLGTHVRIAGDPSA